MNWFSVQFLRSVPQNKKSTYFLKSVIGRSMIEMLGVLAIIGVLSIGGLYAYRQAMERHHVNRLFQIISATYFEGISNCTGKGNCLFYWMHQGYKNIQILCDMGYKEICDSPQNGSYTTHNWPTYDYKPLPPLRFTYGFGSAAGSNFIQYNMLWVFTNVPSSICKSLVDFGVRTDLYGIAVNGVSRGFMNVPSSTKQTNAKYLKERCINEQNDIDFRFWIDREYN